jgi:hypothetical protein
MPSGSLESGATLRWIANAGFDVSPETLEGSVKRFLCASHSHFGRKWR